MRIETIPYLPHNPHAPGLLFLALCCLGLSACQDPPRPMNAAEDARISRGMEEVAAGQARSEANVADIEAARRQNTSEQRQKETGQPD